MQIVQRIMSKLVGEEISVEQLEEVSGGRKSSCEDGFATWNDLGDGSGSTTCDYQ
jgi:hypothetical protein